MGANHQGEIKSYCTWAQPSHGFITNIGRAHLEGFGGIAGVLMEKWSYLMLYVHQVDKCFIQMMSKELKKVGELPAENNLWS